MFMSAVAAGGEGATYLFRYDKNPKRVSADAQVVVRADVRELTFNEDVAARDARAATGTTRAAERCAAVHVLGEISVQRYSSAL